MEFPLWLSRLRTQHCLPEDVGFILGFGQWFKDPVLPQAAAEVIDVTQIQCWPRLWCRPAAAAPIQPLVLELPYATGSSLKRKKKFCFHLKAVIITGLLTEIMKGGTKEFFKWYLNEVQRYIFWTLGEFDPLVFFHSFAEWWWLCLFFHHLCLTRSFTSNGYISHYLFSDSILLSTT